MPLNINYDVLEVQGGDEPSASWILAAEGLHRVLLVEVVQQLRKLSIVDKALLLLQVGKNVKIIDQH